MARTEHQTLPRFYHSCVNWHIHNYFNSIVLVNVELESPEFVTNLFGRIKWRLGFLVRREILGRYVTECILRRSPSCNGPSHIVVKVALGILDGKDKYRENSEDFVFYPGTAIVHRTWGVYDTTGNDAESTCSFTGNITIICHILQDIPLRFSESDIDKDLWALSNDLNVFRKAGNLTDLDLKVGGKTFSVHSVIVKHRSPKLLRILNDISRLREIDLTDFCTIQVIQGLIVYWYSGDLEEFPKTPPCTTAANIRFMKQFELMPYVDPEYIMLNTKFKTSKRSITWVIQDIQFCERLKHLERDNGDVYKCEDLPWKLHVYPKGLGGDSNYFTMCIIDTGPFNSTHLELFLKDENDREYFCTHMSVLIFNSGTFTFFKFIPHDEFNSLTEIVLKDNTLRIGCRIIYATGYVELKTEKICFTDEFLLNRKHPYITLADNMKRLFGDEETSNVSLKSGNRIFKVHSAVLAARSRYFQTFFINREYEISISNVINVIMDEVEPGDLENILKYVYYAEKIALNSDLALRLYPVLDKYKITRLENLCSDYLQDNVSVENVLDIIKLAKKFNIAPLEQTALQFVQENWGHISKTEKWLRLQKNNDKLASDILRLISNNTDVKIDICLKTKIYSYMEIHDHH